MDALLNPDIANTSTANLTHFLTLRILFNFTCFLFIYLFIYLFGVLSHFQPITGHTMMSSWKSRGNQYIQLVQVLYCKLPSNGKQLPAFPLEVGPGTEPRSQRWEARVLPLCQCGPFYMLFKCFLNISIV